ncbi:MAG: hypothetical protein ACKVP0_19620 [Pirellulaceae bacterium]
MSRLPYDDFAWHVLLQAHNGEFGSMLEFYVDAATIKLFGMQLAEFPFGKMEEVRFEIGSREGNFAYYLLLRAMTYDRSGHIALQVEVDNRQEGHRHSQASFFIPCEAASLNQFGRRISAWLEKSGEPLVWFAG